MIGVMENQNTQQEICTSATLSTTHLSWTEQGLNLALHGEGPVTKGLSHGTALLVPPAVI